ncbi:hypothetical protein FLL45_00570 [Aliikangiella marina]|uniref:CHAD domain-containing protein n=1 Tax=Aliikangiella marina TaxID=1712262 RepID=A0A545TH69_9GAMM|nr:hypothetical protein [Aliikangiella marina]TQV76491.1 hypothetical protein FLL45_00570 [Aliikangiella marina]
MKHPWIIIAFLFLVAGCTSRSEELNHMLKQRYSQIETAINQLQLKLNANQISNATRLGIYSDKLETLKPEYQELIDSLRRNATTSGPLFLALVDRFEQVKKAPGESVAQLEEKYIEASNVLEALRPATFNDALSDTVNVMADISDGELTRVNSLSKDLEAASNNSQDFGAGSQYIGNPTYGQWRTGSDGLSFWEWYGIYALFDNLSGGRRHYYHSWSRSRPYSYYHDYGRYRYTSPANYKKQSRLETRTQKSFRSQGKRFSSPYAKQRVGASRLSKESTSRPSSGSFRKASSYRNSASSTTRRGSSRTSRGPSRGK